MYHVLQSSLAILCVSMIILAVVCIKLTCSLSFLVSLIGELLGIFLKVFTSAISYTEDIIFTYVLKFAYKLPISWYVVAAVTVVPIAVDIPRDRIMGFLVAYCIANILVIMSAKKQVTTTTNNTSVKESVKANAQNFFTDLKITLA